MENARTRQLGALLQPLSGLRVSRGGQNPVKTVHAVWERKNLGRDAWEVTLDKKDMADVQSVIGALHDPQFDGCYVCVKLPVGNLRMVHALEDDGFRFLETQLHLVEALEPSDVMRYGASADHIPVEERVVPKTREAWGAIIEKITPGMFDTDRIALDPAFGPDVACQRYRNWCWDLFENPRSAMSVSSCEGEDVSFGIALHDPATGICDSVIGGNFSRSKDFGLGALVNSKAHFTGRVFKTAVSSNNLPMFRIHQNLGRIVRNEQYVFRKLYP